MEKHFHRSFILAQTKMKENTPILIRHMRLLQNPIDNNNIGLSYSPYNVYIVLDNASVRYASTSDAIPCIAFKLRYTSKAEFPLHFSNILILFLTFRFNTCVILIVIYSYLNKKFPKIPTNVS